MFFVNAALNDISIGTAGLVALLGYAVVFVGLIALMAVVLVMGKIMVAKKAKTAAAAPRSCHAHGHRRQQARQASQYPALQIDEGGHLI